MKKNFFATLFFVLLSVNIFATENKFNLFGSGESFKLDLTTDTVLLSAGATLTGAAFLFENILDVKGAEFGGHILNKDDVNSTDQIFMNPYSDSLHKVATGLVCVQLLSPAILMATPSEEWLTIGTMYLEAFLFSYGIKDLIKAVVNRARPYMYYEGYPEKKVADGDWCKSFPSGHTTNAFLGAGFTSFVFCKYFPDSPWKYAVIAGSYTAATLVGCLRMASGNHFLTDVLTGAVIGSLCGIVIPVLHTRNTNTGDNSRANAQITPLGISFTVKL